MPVPIRVEKWSLCNHYTGLEQNAVYNLLAKHWSLSFRLMLLVIKTGILHHIAYVFETDSLSCAEDVEANHSALYQQESVVIVLDF